MEQQGPRGLCEEPREKHLSDLCGGSGRTAGPQPCGLWGSPWLSGQAFLSWQSSRL